MTRRVAGVDHRAVDAVGTADHRQAEYYLGLLNELCEDSDRKITSLEAAAARHERRGKVDDARRCRRMIRTEQQEQNKLQHLIAALHRRFSRPASATAPPARASHASPRPHTAHSGARSGLALGRAAVVSAGPQNN